LADVLPEFDIKNETGGAENSPVSIGDGTGSGLKAEVIVRGDGRTAVATDTSISSVNVPQGRYPFPFSWFRLINTGAQNDTLTIFVRGTTADPSVPDRDVADYTKVFTTGAGEVGDEEAMVVRMVSELNSDTNFKNAFLRAKKVKDRAILIIESTKASTVGDFYERASANSFTVTPTGTADIFVRYNVLTSQSLETNLGVDPDNPHSLGVLGVAGTVQIQPGSISDRFELALTESGGSEILSDFDGSVTPVEFSLANNSMYDGSLQYFVTSITIQGLDNGIKLSNFLGLNSALSNGLTWDIKAEDATFSFSAITSTREMKRFASNGGWELDIEAGGDDALSRKELGGTAIEITETGLFATDDYFKVFVNDDLTQVSELKVILEGFTREP